MKNLKFSLLVGYVLLSPAIMSVISFFYILFFGIHDFFEDYFGRIWTGEIGGTIKEGALILPGENIVGGGYTSPIPIYIGLMAIAGAYLIKKKG